MRIRQTILVVVLALIILSGTAQNTNTTEQLTQVKVGVQKRVKLQGKNNLIGRFELQLSEDDIPKNQDRWYVFAMAEPIPKSTLAGTPYKIQIKKKNKESGLSDDVHIGNCSLELESDSCFIKNNDFSYLNQTLIISVHCNQECEFNFVTQTDYAYPLELNKNFRMNFENTAYSKIFTIDTVGTEFNELRILLRPRGFIKYGEPIILLANYGTEVPTREKHDLQGMQIWDDGQGIFLKKQEMKNRTMTILVEGPEQNILSLIAQTLVPEEKIQLQEFWPEFDHLGAGEKRDFVAEIKDGKSYILKVMTFSGFLDTATIFKLVDNRNVPLNFAAPNQKYGQYQFRVERSLIVKENIQKIVLRVTAAKSTSFLVSFSYQHSNISILHPYISESAIMQPKEIDQYYIKIEELIESQKKKKSSQIEIILGNTNGNLSLNFYKCNQNNKPGNNYENCEYKKGNQIDFTELIPSKVENMAETQRYWFDIDWLDYVKKGSTDKTQVVLQLVVVIENLETERQSFYEIQYKNKDRIHLMKQGELVRDRVFINQKRHYKLSVKDLDAKQVRIHCTKISGEAIFSGSMTDPRLSKNFDRIDPVLGVISMTLKSGQNEVFVEVEGIQSAYYSLTTQIIRASQGNHSKKNGTGYNELIVKEQTSYEFLISPHDSIVLQVHTSGKVINMDLKASSVVEICMTEDLERPPFNPNCDIRNETFLSLNQKLYLDKGTVGNIGIKNNNNENVTIRIQILGNKTEGKCQVTQMNQFMFKRIKRDGKDTDGDIDHCLEYIINKKEEIELIVELDGNFQYDKGSITASINNNQIIKILSPSHIFTKEEVIAACGKNGASQDTLCSLKVKIQNVTDTRLIVLAQYTQDAVRLLDGVSHSVRSLMKKSQPKHFYVRVHNLNNLTIFLQNELGQYKIYANLMKYDVFQKQNKSKSLYPTAKFNDFVSSNPFYYLEQIVTVPKEKFIEKCSAKEGQRWVNCVLLISVYLDGTQEILKNGKFIIEASQRNRELKEGVPLNGFLQQKSTAFYHLQNEAQKGTILINVNNQNKNCLNIYIKQGSVPASNSDNDGHSKASNTLIFPNAKPGTYTVTVQAISNCPYSLSFTVSKKSLQKIKKGAFVDVDLKQGEQKNFLFENLVNETFKVLSAHKSGEVIISVNSIFRDQLEQVAKQDFTQVQSWAWSNKDSVKINNTDKAYCVDCFFLINVKATRRSEASIIIPAPDTQLPLTTDSLVKDLLVANESSVYRVFTEAKSQFEIYIQYGKLRITITESDKDKPSFTKEFSASMQPLIESFNLSQNTEYEYLRYSKVLIEGLENTYYSFAILSNEDPSKRGGMKYGIPEYLFLEKNKQKCLDGILAPVDRFLFSFSKNEKSVIEKLTIKLTTEKKSVKFTKEMGTNQMILTSEIKSDKSELPFELCLTSQEPLSITVIQSSPVNYLPEKTNIMVIQELNLTFGSEGKNIIQINECKSRAVTQIYSSFNNIKSTSSQIRQRRRTNNIIEFFHYGPVFVSVRSKRASIRWFSYDESTGSGHGYDDYQAGFVRVYKQQGNILASAPHLSPVGTPKSKVKQINYTFLGAKQQGQLYEAMNCQSGEYVFQTVSSLGAQGLNGKVEVSFDIQKTLKPKFSKYEYFLIGMRADVVTVLPSGQEQRYRFFYPYQQVGRQMLLGIPSGQGSNTLDEGEGIFQILGYILLAILALFILYWAYNRWIKKYFSKKVRLNEDGMEMKYADFSNVQ